MRKNEKFKTLEESILRLQQEAQSGPISIRKIVHLLSGKGRVLILIFLSLPFCLPIQIPGLSTPFGLAVAFVSLRMIFGKNVWLPQKVLSRTITTKTLQKITKKALFLIRKMQRWICPRLRWVCQSSSMQIVNCLTIFALGIVLALPLPVPFSNLIAAWSIFLIALGILEGDGLFVLVGYVASLLTIALLIITALSIQHVFFTE